MKTRLLRALFGLLLMPASLATARADAYHVSLDTSSLFANPGNGPFSLNFQLIDGDGVANNTVHLTHFLFGGGSTAGSPTHDGGSSGSLSGGITLTDPDPGFVFNAFTEGFVPGSLLEFDLAFTSLLAGGPTPDRFTFAILDGTLAELPTTGPFHELLGIDLTGPNPTIEVYSLLDPYSGTPTLSTVTAVPEFRLLAFPLLMVLAAGTVRRLRVDKRSKRS